MVPVYLIKGKVLQTAVLLPSKTPESMMETPIEASSTEPLRGRLMLKKLITPGPSPNTNGGGIYPAVATTGGNVILHDRHIDNLCSTWPREQEPLIHSNSPFWLIKEVLRVGYPPSMTYIYPNRT